jgi:CheY-like chemotaxis protein
METKPRVLIVDDDSLVRGTFRDILGGAGFEVYEAADGSEAVALIEGDIAVDVVITDVLMPEKEGIETIVEIRKRRPRVPIIAVSGGGLRGNLDFLGIAGKFGADRTLVKPIDRAKLIETVRELLADRE